MDSQYPKSFVKIDALTLELLPLSLYTRQFNAKPSLAFCADIFTFPQNYYI